MKLDEILQHTNAQKYAVGAFSARYEKLIQPVLQAAQACNSPVIVQVSQKELTLYETNPKSFAEEFFRQKSACGITVPTTLHLDHTKDFNIIKAAIEGGFESVMIDASEKSFEENADITLSVVEYAHARGVSVEAELGRIAANDQIETDGDDELYTVPEEALDFVKKTGIDALAVSVGTAHGVYRVKQPTVNYEIISKIKSLTPVHLVLHGGSGVPADMVIRSFQLENGGIGKVNIATDLEHAFLAAVGQEHRMTNEWCNQLPEDLLAKGRDAVYALVTDKIKHYLHSDGKAW